MIESQVWIHSFKLCSRHYISLCVCLIKRLVMKNEPTFTLPQRSVTWCGIRVIPKFPWWYLFIQCKYICWEVDIELHLQYFQSMWIRFHLFTVCSCYHEHYPLEKTYLDSWARAQYGWQGGVGGVNNSYTHSTNLQKEFGLTGPDDNGNIFFFNFLLKFAFIYLLWREKVIEVHWVTKQAGEFRTM